jgi:hypothetical protein
VNGLQLIVKFKYDTLLQDDQEGLFDLVTLNFIFKWYNWRTSGR